MIALFCRGKHKTKQLCSECYELLNYAAERQKNCPFGDAKPFCSNCTVHCYITAMRERIKAVMRYSGPRMIFRYPLLVCVHYLKARRERVRLAKGKDRKNIGGGDR